MGTFAQCYIQCDDAEKVVSHIEAYFTVQKKEILDDTMQWWPLNWDEQRGDVMIVSSTEGWISVEFDYYSNYIHDYDEWFKHVSANLGTLLLFGFYQSTVGHSRLMAVRNGEIQISVEHKDPVTDPDVSSQLELTENMGLDDELAGFLQLPAQLSAQVYGPSIIDHDVISSFFRRLGCESYVSTDNKFIHLERKP